MIIIYSGTLMPLAVFLYSGFFRTSPGTTRRRPRIDGASRASSSGSCCR